MGVINPTSAASLGLGTMSTQNANNVAITGGSSQAYMPAATTFNGTTGTLAAADMGLFQVASNASTQTITVPTNASVAIPVGSEVVFFQQGAGQVVFAAAGGVTIQSASSALKIASQFGAATLKKTATDTWALFGNIST